MSTSLSTGPEDGFRGLLCFFLARAGARGVRGLLIVVVVPIPPFGLDDIQGIVVFLVEQMKCGTDLDSVETELGSEFEDLVLGGR